MVYQIISQKKDIAAGSHEYKETEAEFKEFEPRFKFIKFGYR